MAGVRLRSLRRSAKAGEDASAQFGGARSSSTTRYNKRLKDDFTFKNTLFAAAAPSILFDG